MFETAQLVRYSQGETALMMITKVMPGYGGSVARYYGYHCMGGTHGAYHEDVSLASAEDAETWKQCTNWRE
jgi:hypothetical protein